MVYQKRLDSGSIGYQIPKMPSFPRSARGKRSPLKTVEVNQICPFDLLATVAEELLAKRESRRPLYEAAKTTSTVNKIKQEQFDNGSSLKSEVFDWGSYDESSFVDRFVSRSQVTFNFEEHFSSPEERTAVSTLALVKCDVSEKNAFIGIHNFEDPVDLDVKSTALVSSDCSVEIPPIGAHHSAGRTSFSSVRGDIELLVDKDDYENSSGRTHGSNIYARAFKPHCTGDGRVRRMTKSKYWKPSREAMDDGELWNDDEEIKPVFRSRKLCYTRQRTQRSSFKGGKLFERCIFSASNGGIRSKAVSDTLVKDCMKLDSIGPHADLNAHRRAGSTIGHTSSYESIKNHVKLSIKSFRVPELFIEIPANATVGSLKRAVMEAVTDILSGGLRVGVLLKGKKIRDDNKTILQAGISDTDKLENLGFTLEPNPSRTPLHNSCFCEPKSLTKIHAPLASALGIGTFNALNPTADCTESGHDSVHSPTNHSSTVDKMANNSKALVPILVVNPEALAVVPISSSKGSEMVQRRIRRPFSVLEVEALVHAVEKLGTGRTNGRHWCTQLGYPLSREGVSLFHRSYWIGFSWPMPIGLGSRLSRPGWLNNASVLHRGKAYPLGGCC